VSEPSAKLFGNRGHWRVPGDDPERTDPHYQADRLLASLVAQESRKIPFECYGIVAKPGGRQRQAPAAMEERTDWNDPTARLGEMRRAIYEKYDEAKGRKGRGSFNERMDRYFGITEGPEGDEG